MDVAKVAEREARHRQLQGALTLEEKEARRLRALGRESEFVPVEIAPDEEATAAVIVDFLVLGHSLPAIAEETGLPFPIIERHAKSRIVKSRVRELQQQRQEYIAKCKDEVEVKTYQNLLRAGQALESGMKKLLDQGMDVAALPLLHNIYKDLQDRVGHPVIKHVESRSTHADLGNPIVARLLTQNQKFRAIDGGRAEVVVEEPKEEEKAG